MGNPRQRRAKKEAARLAAISSAKTTETVETVIEEILVEEMVATENDIETNLNAEEALKEAAVESLKKASSANSKTSKTKKKSKKGTISLFGNKEDK